MQLCCGGHESLLWRLCIHAAEAMDWYFPIVLSLYVIELCSALLLLAATPLQWSTLEMVVPEAPSNI